jgi:hypothetical protein
MKNKELYFALQLLFKGMQLEKEKKQYAEIIKMIKYGNL